jgi:hypothetical protein
MSLPALLASLLSNEAEAKQFYASESGEVPKDIPLNLRTKALSDILEKEPTNPAEFKELVAKEFRRRVDRNSLSPDPEDHIPVVDILNNLDHDLLQAALGKLDVKNMQDVVPKTLTALGASPEQQARMNQIYIMDPKRFDNNQSGPQSYQIKGKTISSTAEPLGTGIGGLKASSQQLQSNDLSKNQFFGAPIKPGYSEDNFAPLARVKYYPNIKDDQAPRITASTMAHELIHSLAQKKAHEAGEREHPQYFNKKLPEDISLDDALAESGFMDHFQKEKIGDEELYGLYGAVAKMTHPEWFAKKEALKKMASPTPSPTPIDEE